MRCYFHLVNCHDALLDDRGADVADMRMAEADILAAIQESWQDGGSCEDLEGWQLNVTDGAGEILLTIPLAPAP